MASEQPSDRTEGTESPDERPNEMPEGQPTDVAPLDESPDGQTASDTTESSKDSLPPGA